MTPATGSKAVAPTAAPSAVNPADTPENATAVVTAPAVNTPAAATFEVAESTPAALVMSCPRTLDASSSNSRTYC